MPVKFRCQCGRTLIASRRLAGRTVRCPKCEQAVRIPRPPSEPPKAAESRSRPVPPPPPVSKTKFRPLSTLVPLSEPEPPPIQTAPACREPAEPAPISAKSAEPGAEERGRAQPKPPPLPPRKQVSTASAKTVSAVVPNKAPESDPPDATPGQEILAKPPRATAEVLGYEPDRGKVATVRNLAAAVALTALFSVVPAVLDIVEHFRVDGASHVARWAYILMLVGLVQLAYAVYLVQLPDWSTVWVVTLVTLVMATGYAMMLGFTFLSREESHFVQLLDFADKLRGGKAAGWCFIMLCMTSLLSYFSGRIGVRWRATYKAA